MSSIERPTDRLYFTRESERRTSDDKLRDQLEFIAQRGLGGSRGRGWGYEIGPIRSTAMISLTAKYRFEAWIHFFRKSAIDPSRELAQRQEIYEWAAAAGNNARFGRSPWRTKLDDITPKESTQDPESATPLDEADAVPLSSISRIHRGNFYSHLYGLDAQINVLLSSIQAAADSNMSNRFHSLLHGDPGCGKTDILLSTSHLLTSLGISHISVDATSATEAGMRKMLLDEDAILPDVILLEEVEKTPENSLRYLLGIMDDRATITQTNARRVASRKVPALVLATANDYELLRKMMYGALLSRFSNEIYCPRPNREILAQILKREVEKVKGGDLAWIEPTLKFCYDERKITDPRMLKRVCLCGKEKLITGEYQRDLEKTIRSQDPGVNTEAFQA